MKMTSWEVLIEIDGKETCLLGFKDPDQALTYAAGLNKDRQEHQSSARVFRVDKVELSSFNCEVDHEQGF